MRWPVIHANPSDTVTDKVVAPARHGASSGTGTVPVTGTFGARVFAAPLGRGA